MEFEFRSFDKAIQQLAGTTRGAGRHAIPKNMSFTQQGAFDIRLRDDLFLTSEGFDAGVLQKAQAGAERSRGLPVGMAELRDVHVHLPSGVVIDTVNECVWQGWLLNWVDAAIRRNIVSEFGGHSDDESLILSEEALRNSKPMESAILVTAAGYNVYGHWLVDYLPRINRVADEEFQRHKALRQPQKKWASSLARLFAPRCEFENDNADQPFVRVERLLVPTTARVDGGLEEHSMRSAWTRLNDILKKELPSDRHGRRLFISRQQLEMGRQTRRLIHNIGAVERKAVAAGFEAVHPETMSFAEQRRLFSEAAVILGEDGSGMHNAIFCRPGARMGVISTDRKNTLHAMIANICGLHITHISAIPVEDEAGEIAAYRAKPRDFDAMLDILLAGL